MHGCNAADNEHCRLVELRSIKFNTCLTSLETNSNQGIAMRRITLTIAAIAAVAVSGQAHAGDGIAEIVTDLPLIVRDDFESGHASRWLPSDPHAWQIEKHGDGFVYSLFQQSQVETPVRSPFNRSLIKDVVVSDFVLDVRLQSTIKDYGHRDLCLFFGYQDPAHMYYVHLGKKTDDHANQIFIVNDAPRTKISTRTTPGTNWDDQWHHVRIVRDIQSGSIEVYFDDMEKPVMSATDVTFRWGQVGVGSFDDTGRFDDLSLFAKQVTRPAG